MSLVPLIFSPWWEDLDRPHHLLDQDFGLGIYPNRVLTPQRLELYLQPQEKEYSSNYIRSLAELLRATEKGDVSTVKADKNQFQVTVDVQQFRPEEIDVKVVDRNVIINAKHEEKQDEHGWISREFTRKYLIPDQCDVDQVTSKLSLDGVLTISAPRKEQSESKNEKIIKIEHTGKPALKAQEFEDKTGK